MNTMPIEIKRRLAEEVPAATIALWANECGLNLTAVQIEMLALQWRVSTTLAVAENAIKVNAEARAAAFESAIEIADLDSSLDWAGGSTGNAKGTAMKIAALIAALAAQQPGAGQGEWRAIGTAPKDGTRILVWPYWSDGLAAEVAWRAMKRTEGRWEATGGLWASTQPTHWQPLPTPPVARLVGGRGDGK